MQGLGVQLTIVVLMMFLGGCSNPSLGTFGPGSCTETPASVNWRIHFVGGADHLVDSSARPLLEGQIHVGESISLQIRIETGDLCESSLPSVTWHLTNPAVATISGGDLALLAGITPGETQVSATVLYRGRQTEAKLFWCQPPPGGGPSNPFPVSQCTWIPMSGVKIIG
jgi:hypothetical protein